MGISSTRGEAEQENGITRSRMVMAGVASAGYDALCAILELEFQPDGQIWQYYDVPEHVWYDWRKTADSSSFFHTNILGKYEARQIG